MLEQLARKLKDTYPVVFDELLVAMDPYKNIFLNLFIAFGQDPELLERIKKVKDE